MGEMPDFYSKSVRISGRTAVWDYVESDVSYPACDGTKVFSQQCETNPMRQVAVLHVKATDTGVLSIEIIMVRSTPRQTRPLGPLCPFEEAVNTDRWLVLSEETMGFWDNDLDAVYDDL
jgi:hypothetical protein